MPYLNLKVATTDPSPRLVRRLAGMLAEHTAAILGKRPEVTSIAVEFVPVTQWFVGGQAVDEPVRTTVYLDIKITEGTNTKVQKAQYIAAVWRELRAVFDDLADVSYIVIDEVRADGWGYQGETQEHRFIHATTT